MAKTRNATPYFLTGLAAVLLLVLSRKDLRLVPVALAAPPHPSVSSEMERLAKFYSGTWEYTETYGKSPAAPDARKNAGVYTSEPGPGGNSIVNRFHSRGPVGD